MAVIEDQKRRLRGAGEELFPRSVEALVGQSALGRSLEPRDLTGTAVFLASDDSALMTGQCMVVDAGCKIS